VTKKGLFKVESDRPNFKPFACAIASVNPNGVTNKANAEMKLIKRLIGNALIFPSLS
jgi:hypothetical protein